MSEYTPTTDEVRRQYRAPAVSVDLTDPQRKGENFADYLSRVAGVDAFRHQQASYLAFDRWLAEVERAAVEKALTEMANELLLMDDGGRRGLAGHSKSSASAITHRHAVAVVRARAEAYRREGKEQ